jgi:hypothetical protein
VSRSGAASAGAAGKVGAKKPNKRGCLAALSAGQKAEMRRVLVCDTATLSMRHTGKQLYDMWNKMGVTSQCVAQHVTVGGGGGAIAVWSLP